VKARKTVAVTMLAVAVGCAGCRQESAPVQPQDELSQIQTTLDAIDSELAGDGSP
jgi:hypothetical protein